MVASQKVELFQYDLSNGMAAAMSLQLTGRYFPAVWHTSIVVYGREFFFGQGIQSCSPGTSHHGLPHTKTPLGVTHLDKETFDEYMQSLHEIYQPEKYHLLEFNCNTFTNDVSNFLCGKSIPQDIIDLPREFLSTPFGASLRPMIDRMYRGDGAQAAVPPQLGAQLGNNPALASALQQVAQSAQGAQQAAGARKQTGTAPNGQSSQSAQTLSSSLTYATNMSSFRSLLSSNRCVAVMFTGEWCGPCKVVKPVFEDLSRRAASEPPITFVLVDTTAGQEIASHYKVSAVPTFKFFLEGSQLHEIRGADAGELRTQVAILGMSGYPAHSHTKLKLPNLRQLSTHPVLFEQKPNLVGAIAKLDSFIVGKPEAASIISTFAEITPLLGTPKARASQLQTLTKSSHATLRALEPPQFFPLLDILKFAVLDHKTATIVAETLFDGHNLIHQILAATSQAELPKPTLITLLRLLSNSLSSPILGASILSSPAPREQITQVLVKGLLEEEKSVRTCAGSLAYGIIGWMRRNRKEWTDESEADKPGYQEQEEWEMELCTALLEALDREQIPEVAHRLLASLGGILLFSPHFDQSLSSLVTALEGKRITQSKKGLFDAMPEAAKLVPEVAELCEST